MTRYNNSNYDGRMSKANRTKVINIRLTDAEHKMAKERAEITGLTLSSYGRFQILNRPITSRVDLAAINELRRQGGLVKHIYNQSQGAYATETAAVLRSLAAAIDRITQDDREEDS